MKDVVFGDRGLQFCDSVMETELMVSLFDEAQPVSEPSFELAPSTTSDFQNIALGNRDIMIVLTSETPIKFDELKIGNESILVIGQMSTPVIERLAKRWEMKFTPTEQGVYSSRFRPGDGT